MRMKPWKKAVVATAVVAASLGAGAAWADGNGANAGPDQAVQADSRMTGGGTTETKFVPVEPCRLVDTRASGGTFTNGTTRFFDVRGTGSTFASQGGKANGCGIPDSGVSAAEITISAVTPSAKGFLRAFPNTPPAATFLSYTAGTDIGNTGTVALCGSDGSICLANRDLGIKNFGANTHVVVDVLGYYAQPLSVVVNADATLARGSRNGSVSLIVAGEYDVIFDRDVRSCALSISTSNTGAGRVQGYATASARLGVPNGIFVQTFNSSNNAANLPFHLTVTC